MWAIIGSSGFEEFDEFEIIEPLPRETPFGLCSNGLYRIKVNDKEMLFLCRTGQSENILPSKINYRANIYVLKKYGATAILALSSVRSLQTIIKPGEMVIPYQYIDRTKGLREATFCDDGILAYVSLTHPISEEAANKIKQYKKNFDFPIHFGQVCICIDGPQFPTMVDAKCYQVMGGGVIGMTAFPEFVLAREAGLHYLPCNFIVDYVPWSNNIINNDCILQTRFDNHAKAVMLVKWVGMHLTEFALSDCNDLGIASSISGLGDRMTPKQQSWFSVLAKSNSVSVQVKPKSELREVTLYHGLKMIPDKLQNLLDFVNKYKKESPLNIESVRRSASSLMLYAGEKIELTSIRDFALKLDKREINVRLYHPDPSKYLPIIIYTHGGGFVSGTLNSFDSPCRYLAKITNRVVLAIDYRLAPENPYPSGLDDVYIAAKWAYNHAHDIKASNEDFTLAGDSSGGNYTVLCIEKSLQTRDFNVTNQILIYPTTDLSHNTESMCEFSQGYLLESRNVNWYNEQYRPKGINADDSRISPLYIKNLEKMPRTLVFTAGYDPLRDEGLLFAQALMERGVDTHHYHFDNMIHGFINFGKLVPQECEILYQRIDRFLTAR